MALRITTALWLALALLSLAAPGARAQDGTPAAGTPPAGAPAAPSELMLLGYVAYWTDNSGDEDGFRLRYRVFGQSGDLGAQEYDVPANTTTFALPPAAPRTSCPDYPGISLTIVAFNESGESATEGTSILGECEPILPAASVPSPAEERSLPATGLRSETTSWRSPYLQTIVASFLSATVVLGLALRAGGRRR